MSGVETPLKSMAVKDALSDGDQKKARISFVDQIQPSCAVKDCLTPLITHKHTKFTSNSHCGLTLLEYFNEKRGINLKEQLSLKKKKKPHNMKKP